MIERVVDSRVRFSMVRRVVGIGGDMRACPSTCVTLQMYMCVLLRGGLVSGGWEGINMGGGINSCAGVCTCAPIYMYM